MVWSRSRRPVPFNSRTRGRGNRRGSRTGRHVAQSWRSCCAGFVFNLASRTSLLSMVPQATHRMRQSRDLCILGGAFAKSNGPCLSWADMCLIRQCCQPDCIFCQSPKTNLCPRIRSTQGSGVMPDGTTRFSLVDGTPVYHFMGCSTFSEYTVLAEISCAKINPAMPLYKAALFGCGVS